MKSADMDLLHEEWPYQKAQRTHTCWNPKLKAHPTGEFVIVA